MAYRSDSQADYHKIYREVNKDAQKAKMSKYYRTPEGFKKRLVTVAKRRALLQNLPFNISVADLDWPATCPVLGTELIYSATSEHGNPSTPSLDKIIPELGYVKDNVMVVSQLANRMKNNASPEQLLKFSKFWVDRLEDVC